MTVLIILVSVLVLGAVTLVVSACRLSSRMSQAGIAVRPDDYRRGAKDMETPHDEAYREEYARVTRVRDGVGRR